MSTKGADKQTEPLPSPSSMKLDIISEKLGKSIADIDAIRIEPYLDAFTLLLDIVGSFGPLFAFMPRIIKTKIDTLRRYSLNEKYGSHYHTVQDMLAFERERKFASPLGDGDRRKATTAQCGAEALLDLNRGFHFLALFLADIADSDRYVDQDDTTSAGRRAYVAYKQTLGPYDSFAVKKAVKIALLTALPDRDRLIQIVAGRSLDAKSNSNNKNKKKTKKTATPMPDKVRDEHEQEIDEKMILGQMAEMAQFARQVYAAIHAIFERENILPLLQ